ncbi:uncharacterized protein [Asterias amurensis]|uniref:uncharacterized protein isoform X2 n=1 Tax=Asterias amurensis TaxID=7602 RepID=UPI003AB54C48
MGRYFYPIYPSKEVAITKSNNNLDMESLRPLQTLADLQDALSAARTDYNHSSAKVVTNKKHIGNSKKMAFKSSFMAKSNHAERSEPVDTKKQLEVDQAVAASNDRESEGRHIQIFVSNPVKESLCLQLHPSTTISDLKEIIQERLNIQAKNQHLVTKRGIELCDTQSLMVLGIQQDTNLELRQVAGLMGGARKWKFLKWKRKKSTKTQDKQEKKTLSESKQEDVTTESMETSCTIAGIPGTSTSAVQSQRTSLGVIPKNTRGRNEQMKPKSRKGLVTQQSASTEKQDCLVQSHRTSTSTGAIPKNAKERKEQMTHQSREGLVTKKSASTEKQGCLVQSQRTSTSTGAISENARERKEQMTHQSREGLVTQQSASTEKQDCLVQSQRTSPRTGAIPKNTREREEQMKPQSQTKEKNHLGAPVHLPEVPKPHQGASVHLPEEPKPHQSALVHLPEEPKPHQSASVHLSEEPKPHQGALVHLSEEPKPHQSASVHLSEEPKPHQGALVHLSEEPKPHQSASVHLSEEPKPHEGASVYFSEEPKPHESVSIYLLEEPKPHQSASVHLSEEPKPHEGASVHLSEEPKPHEGASVHLSEEPKHHKGASVHLSEEPEQSVLSAAGDINEIASNCDSKDSVPAIHQDLAKRSQSSDPLNLYHQAKMNDMSIGEGSNVFMAPASEITCKKKVIQHVYYVTGAQAIADMTGEALKEVDMTIGTPDPSHQAQAISDELPEALKQVYMTTGSFVQMLPWVDDDQMHIMDIYTELVLVVLNDKLDLSHTNLGGRASLWAPPLKKMKHLTELTFIGCNLMGKDMAHIAESEHQTPVIKLKLFQMNFQRH